MRGQQVYHLVRKGIVFMVLVLMNCKDPITLTGEGSIGLLVIDGKVNTLPGPYTLRLGYTVGLDQKPSPVDLAQAVLIDDDANLTEYYVEEKPGVYTVPGSIIQGTPGHRYHVEIVLNNGRKYATAPNEFPMQQESTRLISR
ncbi:MAG: DUF4249 family protein [Bacteroidota bacterium]